MSLHKWHSNAKELKQSDTFTSNEDDLIYRNNNLVSNPENDNYWD